MIPATRKFAIAFVAFLTLSACANQDRPRQVGDESMRCQYGQTLVCDEFADETYNCSCQRGDNLREMLDAYSIPDY